MTAPSKRPKIGILLDYVESGSFSTRPHYALRQGYFDAVWGAGGVPIALSYISDAANAYLAICDGLILPGGFYPFPAAMYGEPDVTGETVHPRYAFERDFVLRALDEDKPMLGICAGMQVIAAAKGATLYRDVRDELPTDIDHLNAQPAEATAHGISIVPGTRFTLDVDLPQDLIELCTLAPHSQTATYLDREGIVTRLKGQASSHSG